MQNCKIGVIYQRANQINESDIFSNNQMSQEMSYFLQRISTRVQLKGFDKYRADLDIKDDLHGSLSYFTEYENHEIMFNIAPMIPSRKVNEQFIERKGLVGNAFVCVVFQEEGAAFMPDRISGRVTHVFITVQQLMIDQELYYKVGRH
jgi:hypothetical protein